ncbi:MAG: SPOR domain-containing protein [Sphingomicrobium sp.]
MSDRGLQSHDQLPWLQGVEDEQQPRGLSARRMFAALLFVAAAVALTVGAFFWLGQRESGVVGMPELIAAPPGPYKIKPSDPGGLDVSGDSRTAFETSAGEDRDSRLNLDAMTEEPVAKPPKDEPKRIPPGETREPLPPEGTPAPVPGGGSGSTIQLGAFQNQAQAERAWSALSTRFPAIAAMNKLIVPFGCGIRLRAGAPSPAEARAACQALKAAGENCFVAN